MLNFPIGKLLKSHSHLITFLQVLTNIAPNTGIKLAPRDYQELIASINDFLATCNDAGLLVTKSAADTLKNDLSLAESIDGAFAFRDGGLLRVKNSLNSMQHCFENESPLKVAMILPAEKVGLFDSKEPLFGCDVDGKFPSVAYEIDEAGKCLALNRYTACVFHCMRAMEKGLDAVFVSLALKKGQNPNWGGLLKEIKLEIDRRKATSTWNLPSDENFFPEVYVSIDAMRNAWRNATMHIENKYTEEEAINIFNSVKAFMQKLALRMDEYGKPLA